MSRLFGVRFLNAKAKEADVDIFATASWSSQSTFSRFNHSALDAPTVTGAVFNSLGRPML